MTRRFNKKQRIALELNGQGLCQLCGVKLPKHWHADHVYPYSKGGDTDVINGQALCPHCNMTKGNKTPMKKITLRSWQQKAFDEAIQSMQEQKLFLTHATPGGGKTIHGLSVADQMIKDGTITHVVVLAPSTSLVQQWSKDAKQFYDFELKNSMLYSGMSDFHEYDGIIMTYQGMNENHENLRVFCDQNRVLVIADEIHHVADGQSWGEAFRNGFELSKNILALTGTPWASNGKIIPYIRYTDDGYADPDFAYDKKTAIKLSLIHI